MLLVSGPPGIDLNKKIIIQLFFFFKFSFRSLLFCVARTNIWVNTAPQKKKMYEATTIGLSNTKRFDNNSGGGIEL